MKIDVTNWREFTVSDLFEIINGKGITVEEIENHPGDFEAVQSGEGNNGVMGRISKAYCIDREYSYCEEPCLTVARSGSAGYVSYHENGCVAGDSAKILVLRDCEARLRQVYLFLQTLLSANRFKYTYGRKVTEDLYGKMVVKVPVTRSGKPDWQWMESFICSLRSKPLTTKNHASSNRHIQDSLDWGNFLVKDLFHIIGGKGITKEEIENHSGDFEAVQSGEGNNGVLGLIDKKYCNEMGYSYCEEPCLTVARSGSAGFVSLHNKGCVVGDSAKILLLKEESAKSIGVYLFLQTLLTANRFKYTYGRKVTETLYGDMIVKLPMTADKKPDWRFMEEYIKSLPYGDRLA